MTYAVRTADGSILADFHTYGEAHTYADNYRWLTGWAPTVLERDGDVWVEVEVVT